MLNAVYITWNDAEAAGPIFAYADELIEERQNLYFNGRHKQKLSCRTRSTFDKPAWFSPDGNLVKRSMSSRYRNGNDATFFQVFGQHSSQLLLWFGFFDQKSVPYGLYRCGSHDKRILAVGIYLRGGTGQCKYGEQMHDYNG